MCNKSTRLVQPPMLHSSFDVDMDPECKFTYDGIPKALIDKSPFLQVLYNPPTTRLEPTDTTHGIKMMIKYYERIGKDCTKLQQHLKREQQAQLERCEAPTELS